jgi:hypothetical protein
LAWSTSARGSNAAICSFIATEVIVTLTTYLEARDRWSVPIAQPCSPWTPEELAEALGPDVHHQLLDTTGQELSASHRVISDGGLSRNDERI